MFFKTTLSVYINSSNHGSFTTATVKVSWDRQKILTIKIGHKDDECWDWMTGFLYVYVWACNWTPHPKYWLKGINSKYFRAYYFKGPFHSIRNCTIS